MDFNNILLKNGIIQQIEANLFGDSPFGSISGNPNRLQIITNYINDAYGRYAILALMSDNSWQFDDNNYTDFPIGNTDLIANQPDYTLNNSQVIIDQVEIRDPTNTIWFDVPELDEREFPLNHFSQSQYNNNVAAIPRQHVKKGNSIYLYPTPVYSVPQGLRVRFKRPPSYFVPTDTIKQPGFNRMHQNYLIDYATWKYAMARNMNNIVKMFQPVVIRWEQEDIPNSYNTRSLEKPRRLKSFYRTSR